MKKLLIIVLLFIGITGEKYPIGLLYPHYHHDFVGIFAIAEKWRGFNKHYLEYSSYAARVAPYRRGAEGNCSDDRCCSPNDYIKDTEDFFIWWLKYHHITNEHKRMEPFNRLVNALVQNNIVPSYYTKSGELVKIM